jgi:hypothetical protein
MNGVINATFWCNDGIFVIFKDNLNGIWDFYHGTNVGEKEFNPKCCFVCPFSS